MFCGYSPRTTGTFPPQQVMCKQCRQKKPLARDCQGRVSVREIVGATVTFLGAVLSRCDDNWPAAVGMNGSPITIEVDTGTYVAVIPLPTYQRSAFPEARTGFEGTQ